MGNRTRSRHRLALAGTSIVVLLVAASTHAALIAGWDFQTTANGGTAIKTTPNVQQIYTANFGISANIATIYLNGTNGSSWFDPATDTAQVNGLAGTALNAGPGFSTTTTSPASLGLLNSGSNGQHIAIAFSMANHQDLVLSYATTKNASGFASNRWAYSTNGTSWTDVGSLVNPQQTTFATVTIDLSSVSAIDNDPTIWLRYTLDGANSASAQNRIDNLQLNATPTPEPASLALIALLAGRLMARRRA